MAEFGDDHDGDNELPPWPPFPIPLPGRDGPGPDVAGVAGAGDGSAGSGADATVDGEGSGDGQGSGDGDAVAAGMPGGGAPGGDGPGAVSGLRLPSDRVREEARRAIEAMVLVAEEPLPANIMGQLLELAPSVVEELCRELAVAYEDEGRGFQLVRVAGGWRYQTHPDMAPYVERFVLDGQTTRLSAAALETLAIVAYKQPLSRAQVSSIRGVSVDGVMRTLQQRGYVAEVARDPGPGQAVLYGTTRLFLEQLGINDLSGLPPLGQFVPDAEVVEQLEQGLRPDGVNAPDRYEVDDAADADAADAVDRFLQAGGRPDEPDDVAEVDDPAAHDGQPDGGTAPGADARVGDGEGDGGHLPGNGEGDGGHLGDGRDVSGNGDGDSAGPVS